MIIWLYNLFLATILLWREIQVIQPGGAQNAEYWIIDLLLEAVIRRQIITAKMAYRFVRMKHTI
jgi:hypothetical protein